MLGETTRLSVGLRIDFDFLHVMFRKDKKKQVFNFIFNVLWTSRSSLVSCVAFFRIL